MKRRRYSRRARSATRRFRRRRFKKKGGAFDGAVKVTCNVRKQITWDGVVANRGLAVIRWQWNGAAASNQATLTDSSEWTKLDGDFSECIVTGVKIRWEPTHMVQ